jgi:hypothetical protein
MIKLLFLAVLCIALYEPVQSKVKEERSKTNYKLSIDFDDNKCCENTCLGTRNSKKISNAVLALIHANGQSYAVLKELKILDLMYDHINYQKWSAWIKGGDYGYPGFKKLQRLVNRYKVCKNVCKVFFQLRKAIRDHAGDDATYQLGITENRNKIVKATSGLIVLADIRDALEILLSENPRIVEIQFEGTTFVADATLRRKYWGGKRISVKAQTVVIPKNIIWDVRGNNGGMYYNVRADQNP